MNFINYKRTRTKTNLFLAFFLLTITTSSSGFTTSSTTKKNILKSEDHIIVVKNNSVIFDLLQTEEDIESPVSIRVIEQPKFGDVTLNDDQSFEYAPLQNLCEKDDLIIYEMTNGNKTTEVTVHIEILCESLTIMNGMGMIEDEEGTSIEPFKILGVENFPNNSLYIFDDEGSQVFQKKDYKNDWNGVIEEDKTLEEDRMYYYVFNDGGGNFYSGYLQIN